MREGRADVEGWTVRVPASTANLGSAFDTVAVALAAYLEVSDQPGDPAPETHPAVRAFRGAGGVGPVTVRVQFPGGRGLGFSGASRVGGLVAARVQQGASLRESRREILKEAADLEGHADNAAASLFGGVVAVAGGRSVRVPLARDLAIVVWIPDRETPTTSSRRLLPEQVSFDDAIFNVGRASLLVAALAAGEVDALRVATEDRLYQDRRLARAHDARLAIEAALAGGAYAAWLSGSGPSIAAFVEPDRAEAIAGMLPSDGRARVLAIEADGVTTTSVKD